MKPKQKSDGDWYVVDDDGNELAGPFDTEEEAKRWIRRHTPGYR